jgi:ABC-type multidrug transport system ATPase subunit
LDIRIESLGKKFFREWIFRKMDFHFRQGMAYAITGPNGSGKSTFLKALSGNIPATEGHIHYLADQKNISIDLWPRYISFAAPYLELVEEFSLQELLKFHFSFKKPQANSSIESLAEQMYLQDALHKQVKNFSSGMKQRLKLGLAFFTHTPVILLDEPTTNLDTKGNDWYLQQIEKIKKDRLMIICSNQRHEYSFCDENVNICHYKYISHKKK